MRKINLTIIIVNYNTRELLRQCLENLNLKAETIVVDNGSTDGSPGMVAKEFPKVKLIKNKNNLGFAKANNQGIKKARGKYILFLNSDTVVRQKTIPALLGYLEDHPKVGAVTPRLELRNGEIDPDCHRGFPMPRAAFCYFTGLERLIPRSKFFGQYHQTWKDLNAIHEIDACCGAFLLTRKKILAEIDGFDESYFFYGEDLDLCFRIKQKGWRVVYYPQVKAIHYKGASSGLRKETRDISQKLDRETRLKVARASTEAMKIFYDKFYRDQYPFWVTAFVLFGIQIKNLLRTLASSNQ